MRRMFSKKQIEEMAADVSADVSADVIDASIETGSLKTELDKKANLSGANFTGDVGAKTLSQTQANYSYQFQGTSSDIGTLTPIYNRVEVINSVLHVILNIKAVATTTKTLNAGGEACAPSITLNSEVSSKIFDLAI